MRINFRSHRFDSSSTLPEGSFRGEDVATWLQAQLGSWDTSVVGEDWGWAIVAKKADLRYIFGVYDHDNNDVTEDGPRWVIRAFNQKDRSHRLLKLFKYIEPVTHEDVLTEIVDLLTRTDGVADVSVEPL